MRWLCLRRKRQWLKNVLSYRRRRRRRRWRLRRRRWWRLRRMRRTSLCSSLTIHVSLSIMSVLFPYLSFCLFSSSWTTFLIALSLSSSPWFLLFLSLLSFFSFLLFSSLPSFLLFLHLLFSLPLFLDFCFFFIFFITFTTVTQPHSFQTFSLSQLRSWGRAWPSLGLPSTWPDIYIPVLQHINASTVYAFSECWAHWRSHLALGNYWFPFPHVLAGVSGRDWFWVLWLEPFCVSSSEPPFFLTSPGDYVGASDVWICSKLIHCIDSTNNELFPLTCCTWCNMLCARNVLHFALVATTWC